MERLRDLVAELGRRRVFRAVAGFGVFAFAALQVFEPIMHGLHLPEWSLTALLAVLAAGFPATVLLAWAYDVTAAGLSRTAEVAAPEAGARRLRGAPLVLLLVGLGVAAAAPGIAWFAWRGGLGRAGAPAPAEPQAAPAASVAVLPFVDLSERQDQGYFADGIAEEILNALAQLEGLHVCGRTSSFSFRGKAEDLREVGRRLGVATVLEGSVRRAGSRVRITAQLVKTADGFHLWSRTFDKELSDMFAAQDEIARAVADALAVKLLPGRAAPQVAATGVREAYDRYLLARGLSRSLAGEDELRALAELEKAVALDPGFAPAWAALASTIRSVEGYSGVYDEARRRRGFEAAERAIALAPSLPEGWVARARLRRGFGFDLRGAREDLEQARALAPGDAGVAWAMGQLLLTLGDFAASRRELERAVEIDPLDARAWNTLAQVRTAAGDSTGSRASIERALELAPTFDEARYTLALQHLTQGRPEAALAEAGRCEAGWARFAGQALAHHALGQAKEAERALAALIGHHSRDAPYQIAEVYAWRGARDQAFEWLDRAVRQQDPGLGLVQADPLLAPIRADGRYAALLARLGLSAR